MLEHLEDKVAKAKTALAQAERELREYKEASCFWVYDTIGEANWKLYDELWERADKDCEGSYIYGGEEYRQKFCLREADTGLVEDKEYVAILYNIVYERNDKRGYFVEDADLKIEKVTGEESE